ncbi:D-glycero-beta-D-manno-heptose 1,7-bisphosphate 7-phosphatase [Alkalilimnicola sp. S0819]|uniref:D-glycero-beta-D-manno-heptose 1,7-bisphosphate 7-phosphatase n=1 Tax=Alkalilimnicola sp. S0819 TaxID=2613922 RepID=UPI001261AEC0|nr:D-glycero-beta-D-manno-heptose 1,7-bisphosphate 7-phosphatase [Alkalilimnicola sp. S0819]KAB7622734.1 D-glycero-beta-D-manno-heptose 1,7-bisphosphate 7-phosphatase [Alkalilimnicola sp. S0819]MPQ17374.1 D-glycero-beta-D-manno-heptose 1,7-bisphosphate 7-phosphatase [Alkalilimnicola sp. S0819]
MRTRLVVLDRDGVLNEDSDAYIKSAAEWRPIPGSAAAVAALKAAGFSVVVASNQSGLGRGLFDQSALDAIHAKLGAELAAAGTALDGLYYCPHAPEAGCECRKPAPGLLRRICADFQLPGEALVMIGDSLRDLQAAEAVGARALLVRTGKGERTLAAHPNLPFEVHADLAAAAARLIAEREQQR